MVVKIVAVMATCLVFAGLAASAEAAPPLCGADEVAHMGAQLSGDDVASRRAFVMPDVAYPFGTKRQEWGFSVKVHVGADGRVACYRPEGRFGGTFDATPQRQVFLDSIGNWRYSPGEFWGHEYVRETEHPQRHVAMPAGDLAGFSVTLSRSPCFGWCPTYRVTLTGDGTVIYTGEANVAVTGTHRYTVAPQAAADLMTRIRASELWSVRDTYKATITDNPSFDMTVTVGGKTKTIHDYAGAWVGMPQIVSDIEKAVDAAADTGAMIHLNATTVSRLAAEGFDFRGPAAAAMLADAIADTGGRDDAAIIDLIDRGAPLTGEGARTRFGVSNDSADLLASAAMTGREAVLARLLRANILPDGAARQARVDAAFQAAIRGGRLAIVEAMWAYHPSLTYVDTNWPAGKAVKTVPVTLLLRKGYGQVGWQGYEIARFLLDHGCDVNAAGSDGTTLLFRVASDGTPDFIQYLIDRGANVNAKNEQGATPLFYADVSEDNMLVLLKAGADPTVRRSGWSVSEIAAERGYARVQAWLAAQHPPQ